MTGKEGSTQVAARYISLCKLGCFKLVVSGWLFQLKKKMKRLLASQQVFFFVRGGGGGACFFYFSNVFLRDIFGFAF